MGVGAERRSGRGRRGFGIAGARHELADMEFLFLLLLVGIEARQGRQAAIEIEGFFLAGTGGGRAVVGAVEAVVGFGGPEGRPGAFAAQIGAGAAPPAAAFVAVAAAGGGAGEVGGAGAAEGFHARAGSDVFADAFGDAAGAAGGTVGFVAAVAAVEAGAASGFLEDG